MFTVNKMYAVLYAANAASYTYIYLIGVEVSSIAIGGHFGHW